LLCAIATRRIMIRCRAPAVRTDWQIYGAAVSDPLNRREVYAVEGVTGEPGPTRILLVEDEPLICMVTAELLGDAGFEVEEAATGNEAMTKLVGHFAAAIIDLGLPDRPGDVLAKDVRRLRPEMPVVIASGRDPREVAQIFAGDAKVRCIGKPYDIEALLKLLRALGVSGSGE
jgi:CheY-like chemotaxis protein